MGRMWTETAAVGKDVFVQNGGKVTVISKEENARWAERYRPIIDEYVKELNSKGLPGMRY